MSTDLLNVAANERIDLADFRHAADVSLQENLRQINTNLLTDPTKDQLWILDGFEMSNPSGKQLQVNRGRALLGQREGAIAYEGVLTTEGNATQIVDMSLLASNTYNVYIRFEYVDGDSASRIFWDASGFEVSQTHATRRNANWSVRVETSSPGAEWLKIGTANNAGASLVIVDQRPLYFEGVVSASYASGWSTEGGGVANDRNADREQYGIADFQTFTSAMRQCIEDIRGRGLRRWWEKGIGGLNIGFDTDPEEDQLHVGNSDFGLEFDGTDPHLVFDDDRRDEIWFDRSAEVYFFKIDAVNRMILSDSGVEIANGVLVGTTSGTPYDNDVWVPGGGINCGGSTNPSSGDGIFTRGVKVGNDTGIPFDNDFYAPDGGIQCGGSVNPGTGDGIFTNGLTVGFDASPAADRINLGDSNLGLQWVSATDVLLRFDANDQLRYDRTTDTLLFKINSVDEALVDSSGMRILNGLVVGRTDLTPVDDVINCSGNVVSGGDFRCGAGGLNAGGSADPGDGDVIATRGMVVGFDAIPSDIARIEIGDTTFYLDWSATAATLRMDTTGGNSGIQFDKTNDQLDFQILGTNEARISSSGLNVLSGLYVGSLTGTATDNDITAAADLIAGNNIGFLGADDYFSNVDNTSISVNVNSVEEARFTASGLAIAKGLYVGSAAGAPTDNDIYAQADITAGGSFYATSHYRFAGANDYISNSDNAYMRFFVNNVEEARLTTTGLALTNGLYVGSTTGTPEDNNIITEGNITANIRFYTGQSYNFLGSNDRIDNTDNVSMEFYVNALEEMRILTTGVTVSKGLTVGLISATPTDNDIYAYGDIQAGNLISAADFSGNSYTAVLGDGEGFRFSAATGFQLNGGNLEFELSNLIEAHISGSGLNVNNGLVVGNLTTTPTDDGIIVTGGVSVGHTTAPVADTLSVGDANFKMVLSTDSYIYYDANDFVQYDRSANTWYWKINNVNEVILDDNGVVFMKGMVIGTDSWIPADNDLLVPDGGIAVGHAVAPVAGVISVGSTHNYWSYSSGNSIFQLGGNSAAGRMTYNSTLPDVNMGFGTTAVWEWSATFMGPQSADSYDCGRAGTRWKEVGAKYHSVSGASSSLSSESCIYTMCRAEENIEQGMLVKIDDSPISGRICVLKLNQNNGNGFGVALETKSGGQDIKVATHGLVEVRTDANGIAAGNWLTASATSGIGTNATILDDWWKGIIGKWVQDRSSGGATGTKTWAFLR